MLQTFLSGPKLPSAAALLRAVVQSKGEARLFVLCCSNLKRSTRRTWASIERAFHFTKKPRWLLIVQKEVFATCCAMRQLCVPYLAEDVALRTIGYFSKRKCLALFHHGLCKGTVDTIQERAATFAKALWLSIANVQMIVWLENFNEPRFGPNSCKLDKSLDATVLAILHTIELPLFEG